MPRVSPAYRAARREEVLAAAARCFARQGFHRATMKDVVREAGMSPGAVYGYFASKAEIIEAIAAARHLRERRLLRGLEEEALPEMLRRLGRGFLGELSRADVRRDRRVGIQVWAEALRDPRLLRLVREGVDLPRALLTRRWREARRRGEVPEGFDPDSAARAMIALFQGFILQQGWEPDLAVGPYLAFLEAVVDAMFGPKRLAMARSRPQRRRVSRARASDR